VSETPQPRSNDLALAAAGIVLGVLAAAGYGAWRAISDEAASAAGRWSAFGEAMLFPGLLVIVAVAAMVWLGWKANIDG
jgi:uncharacterized membrane protein YedE/YeeE